MSVSEWSLPIERGNIKSTVGEYSISSVGPGPRAILHWDYAKKRGLKTVAKVQLNNSWELSAVPYLPVLDLVAEHCERLANADVDGMMLSWSLGGYPSLNLELAERFGARPVPDTSTALQAVAEHNFGQSALGRQPEQPNLPASLSNHSCNYASLNKDLVQTVSHGGGPY